MLFIKLSHTDFLIRELTGDPVKAEKGPSRDGGCVVRGRHAVFPITRGIL